MNPRNIGKVVSTTGTVIFLFAGSAIANLTGLGSKSWLMVVFGLGIFLSSQGQIMRLRQQIHEIQSRKFE